MVKKYKYLFSLLTPISLAASLASDSVFVFQSLVLFFVIIPILELFTNADNSNMSQEDEALAKSSPFYDILIYLFVPCQWFLLGFFLFNIQETTENFLLLGKILTMGISCGILGINVAHELGHRSSWYEKLMSKSLLLTSLYMHFFIEHNYGHHQNVSTDSDPASAHKGESVYRFHLRSIVFGYLSAWSIQRTMLARKRLSFFSLQNEMLIFLITQLVFVYLIYLVFGPKVLLSFLAAALIGILLLETVNYIEHYALKRKRKENGDYERAAPAHSWNSNHPLGRILLFELSRHSDHHFIASRKYQLLRHFDNSPQMPTGYPGMMILSLIPPLWFFIIHQALDKYKNENFNTELA